MSGPNLRPGRLRMLGLHGDHIVSDEEFTEARRVIESSAVDDNQLMTALENAAVARQMSDRARDDRLLAEAGEIRNNRQAGAELEKATQEMIEAGVDAYFSHFETAWPELLVEEIYQAMIGVRTDVSAPCATLA